MVVSRGLESAPYQNPKLNVGKALIVIIPEYKKSDATSHMRILTLATSYVERGSPDTTVEIWNHLSKATDVLASISANCANSDASLMLDSRDFVKTCNSTSFFIVRDSKVWAPSRNNQMHGITRRKTIDICRSNNIPVEELVFSLTEVYTADEAFCTGTFPSQIFCQVCR